LFHGDKEDEESLKSQDKQYLYIVQASLETTRCKIGITKDLSQRLEQYNGMTGKSKDNRYAYLYTCEVRDMKKLERAITEEFRRFREENKKEIYFYNAELFKDYVSFIERHELFARCVSIKKQEKQTIVKIVKKHTPSLAERGITFKDVMQRAKRVSNDEFYTRYEDVEKELSLYDNSVWSGKTVFCNCDDAVDNRDNNTSAFPLYFLKHFNNLKLKKLICTHYDGQVDLFNQGAQGYIFTKTGFMEFGKYEKPQGFTGSFDDPLSIKILQNEADIVCTNPPFSRGIEYWELIIKSGKKFLIISNVAIPLTRAYLHYFKDEKVWAGYNEVDVFLNPKREPVRASGHWYTNIEIKDRPKRKLLKLVPLEEIPDKHKRYDDSGVLLVDLGYIPSDYRKPFGVSTRPLLNGVLELGFKIVNEVEYYPYIDGEKKYSRVLIQKQKRSKAN
jgi:predicted GIY-YIG superfamily endonuclease